VTLSICVSSLGVLVVSHDVTAGVEALMRMARKNSEAKTAGPSPPARFWDLVIPLVDR